MSVTVTERVSVVSVGVRGSSATTVGVTADTTAHGAVTIAAFAKVVTAGGAVSLSSDSLSGCEQGAESESKFEHFISFVLLLNQ